MFIAQELRKKNIGEYFIYMFQIEDLIRACQFDSSLIKEKIVEKYKGLNVSEAKILQWYLDLSDMMQEEQIVTAGHLGFINHKMTEVFDFHLYLLEHKAEYADYHKSFIEIQSNLVDLSKVSYEKNNVVKLVAEAIYVVALLKLKGSHVSDETMKSIKQMVQHLGVLSDFFRKYETGEIAIGDQE